MVEKKQDLTPVPEPTYLITYEQVNTLLEFLRLWAQLTTWSRSLMVSTAGDLENKTAVVNQLFSVPLEFYSSFRIFYGASIAQQLSNLLTNFITDEWRLIHALKEGDTDTVDAITVRLYRTADQLAESLSRINIYWDEEQWRSLLYQYIRLVIDEMVAMLSGDYEREIAIYKRLEDVTELIGSYMARGIIARSASAGGPFPPQ